jgi:ketosteroid isomerase-like protein
VNVNQVAVTGKEPKEHLTPQMRALSEFYQALNGRDMALMARNWAQTGEAVMDNPVGGIRRGWDDIRSVYERVFTSARDYWFEFHDYSYHEAGDVFYVVGRERGEYRAGEAAPLSLAIRTTRVFRRIDGAWRQVHHHGSIDDPELLRAYQQAVRPSA